MPRSSRKARIWLITLVRWQTRRYAMQPLKIKLFDRLDSDKLHGGTQHRLGNRFRVAE